VFKIPRRDKTGPEGKGPRTGLKLGNCKQLKTDKLLKVDNVLLTSKKSN
jgi:hypothetical protein